MEIYAPDASPALRAKPCGQFDDLDVPNIALPPPIKSLVWILAAKFAFDMALRFLLVVLLCIGSLLAAAIMTWLREHGHR